MLPNRDRLQHRQCRTLSPCTVTGPTRRPTSTSTNPTKQEGTVVRLTIFGQVFGQHYGSGLLNPLGPLRRVAADVTVIQSHYTRPTSPSTVLILAATLAGPLLDCLLS